MTAMNAKVEDAVLYAQIVRLKLSIDRKYGMRHQPIRSSIDMSRNDYLEFMTQYGNVLRYV